MEASYESVPSGEEEESNSCFRLSDCGGVGGSPELRIERATKSSLSSKTCEFFLLFVRPNMLPFDLTALSCLAPPLCSDLVRRSIFRSPVSKEGLVGGV